MFDAISFFIGVLVGFIVFMLLWMAWVAYDDDV